MHMNISEWIILNRTAQNTSDKRPNFHPDMKAFQSSLPRHFIQKKTSQNANENTPEIKTIHEDILSSKSEKKPLMSQFAKKHSCTEKNLCRCSRKSAHSPVSNFNTGAGVEILPREPPGSAALRQRVPRNTSQEIVICGFH